MQVDPGAVYSAFGLGMVLFLVAALAKFVGVAGVAGLLMNKKDAMLLGVSMIPRAEIALVVIYQCSKVGEDIISAEVFAAMVVVSLASSIFAPLLLRTLLR
jgi:Kef-type K+ transport system membrane component KefB